MIYSTDRQFNIISKNKEEIVLENSDKDKIVIRKNDNPDITVLNDVNAGDISTDCDVDHFGFYDFYLNIDGEDDSGDYEFIDDLMYMVGISIE